MPNGLLARVAKKAGLLSNYTNTPCIYRLLLFTVMAFIGKAVFRLFAYKTLVFTQKSSLCNKLLRL